MPSRYRRLQGAQRAIADTLGMPQQTVADWLPKREQDSGFGNPPESRQHFDVWQFATGKSKRSPA